MVVASMLAESDSHDEPPHRAEKSQSLQTLQPFFFLQQIEQNLGVQTSLPNLDRGFDGGLDSSCPGNVHDCGEFELERGTCDARLNEQLNILEELSDYVQELSARKDGCSGDENHAHSSPANTAKFDRQSGRAAVMLDVDVRDLCRRVKTLEERLQTQSAMFASFSVDSAKLHAVLTRQMAEFKLESNACNASLSMHHNDISNLILGQQKLIDSILDLESSYNELCSGTIFVSSGMNDAEHSMKHDEGESSHKHFEVLNAVLTERIAESLCPEVAEHSLEREELAHCARTKDSNCDMRPGEQHTSITKRMSSLTKLMPSHHRLVPSVGGVNVSHKSDTEVQPRTPISECTSFNLALGKKVNETDCAEQGQEQTYEAQETSKVETKCDAFKDAFVKHIRLVWRSEGNSNSTLKCNEEHTSVKSNTSLCH